MAPEGIPFIFDFADACCFHDNCYSSTSFTKEQCDLAFLDDNLRACEGFGAGDAAGLIVLLRISPPCLLGFCEVYAYAYYAAVALGGSAAAQDAKEKTMAHEDSEECAAQCPSTQRAGGQGTTVLRVDVLRPGDFAFSYDMFGIPDAMKIEDADGSVLFTTNGLVSGAAFGIATLREFSGSTIVTVTIDAPNDGTAWDVFIDCVEFV